MQKKGHSAAARRLGIAAALLVSTALITMVAVGGFLFNFALNPRAPYTMHDMMSAGQVKGASDKAPVRDADLAAEAASWFKASRRGVSMTSEDGLSLKGWEIDRPDPSATHLYGIFCHGYMDSPAGMAKYAYHFYQQGYSVLLPAARAHERSAGAYIGMGWPERRDVVKWAKGIVERDPEAKIVLYGVSMGAATVMMASGEPDLPANVRLIVEDCGYASVWDEFSLQLGNVFGLPSFPLLNVASAWSEAAAGYSFERASAVEQLARARVPMLFIHGTADTFVPYSMLDVVYRACASPVKEKLSIEGAPHAQSTAVDPDRYWGTVDAFVAANLG